MKLLKSQHQDILRTLVELNITQERLSLIKRKGRIVLSLTGVDLHFEFFRRKSVSITPEEHQWEELEHYELKVSGKPKKVTSWPMVVLELRNWLQSQIRST